MARGGVGRGGAVPGLAASATHGVIRTAHAVRSLHSAGDEPDPLLVDELAQGLGFWAARYQTLPGTPQLVGQLDAVTAGSRLPRLDPTVPAEGSGITGRLRCLLRLDGFAQGLQEWGPSPTPDLALDELIGAAARVLAARSDAPITFCHAVTAPAAVRLVLPVLPSAVQQASVAASWQVVGGIVAAFTSPRQEAETAATGADPDALLDHLDARAIEHATST